MLKRGGISPKEIARGLREEREKRERDREREKPPVREDPPRRPPPPPGNSTSINIDLGGLVQAAGWAWGRWGDYKQRLAEQAQRILALAAQRGGWLRVAHVVEALQLSPKQAQSALEQLVAHQLAVRYAARDGSPLYVFPAFLPQVTVCSYCDGEVLVQARCPNCGAPLGATPPGSPTP